MGNQQKAKCPFCAEEILADAKKCKHCGEWLESPSVRVEYPEKGSVDARAVSKGIKEYEYSKTVTGCLGIIALALAVIVALFTHWVIGLIVFIALGMWIGSKYQKE